MTITHRFVCPIVALSSVRRLVPVVVAIAVSSASAAEPGSGAAEPKTHTLFMGADLSIEQNKKLYRVQDVAGDSFVTKVDGKEVRIPVNRGAITLKVDSALKLTESSATIANLKGERAYTSANDPTRKFMRQQPGTAVQDAVNMEEGNALTLSGLAGAEAAGSVRPPGGGGARAGGGIGNAQALYKGAQETANKAGMALHSEYANMGIYVSKTQQELAQELFDAMEVTFEVSSEKPLNDPYVLIIARFHERAVKPGSSRNWIFAEALKPIDRQPRKVRIMQGGFPEGFVMEDLKVHLYDHGQELATNVAEKRVALTRDEAFQYVLIDYVSSHKGASAPATPAMGTLPPDLRSRLSGDQYGQTFFVKVSKDGLPVAPYVDPSGLQKVDDPYLESVIKEIRFKPALEKGRPVEGIARLKLDELRL